MGSGGSVQTSPTIEVSFIDQTTGVLHKDKEIQNIIKQFQYDFSRDFYTAYKTTNKKSPYYEYKQFLEKQKLSLVTNSARTIL
jgi:hypothetical protein